MPDIDAIIQDNMYRYKRMNERKLEKIMQKYDLRKIDVEILIYLRNCKGRDTAKDIAATGMFTKGHISQSVRRMKETGYLNIMTDEKDMRVQHLSLTKKADRVLKDMLSVKREIEQCVFAGVTEEEQRMMQTVLQKMCDNISRELDGD